MYLCSVIFLQIAQKDKTYKIDNTLKNFANPKCYVTYLDMGLLFVFEVSIFNKVMIRKFSSVIVCKILISNDFHLYHHIRKLIVLVLVSLYLLHSDILLP